MIERVRVSNIDQIKKIAHAASGLNSDVGIHDANGQIADAKSLLGLLRLDYSRPVEVPGRGRLGERPRPARLRARLPGLNKPHKKGPRWSDPAGVFCYR